MLYLFNAKYNAVPLQQIKANKENDSLLNEENKTFKFERHVSATPVPSSVYGWSYNDEQYMAENLNNNSMIQQLITKKD